MADDDEFFDAFDSTDGFTSPPPPAEVDGPSQPPTPRGSFTGEMTGETAPTVVDVAALLPHAPAELAAAPTHVHRPSGSVPAEVHQNGAATPGASGTAVPLVESAFTSEASEYSRSSRSDEGGEGEPSAASSKLQEYLGDHVGESHAEVSSTRSAYSVVNKDTGEVFHIDDIKTNVDTSYSLLPTREDIVNQGNDDSDSDDDGLRRSSSRVGQSPPPSNWFRRKRREDDADRICFAHHKSRPRFAGLRLNQVLDAHPSQIWKLEFNKTGSFLASAGHDHVVRVWRVVNHPDALDEMRRTEERRRRAARARGSVYAIPDFAAPSPTVDVADIDMNESSRSECHRFRPLFNPVPHRVFEGHTNDVIDMSWSYSNFLLTASMDNSVRLWHVSRDECFHIFWHSDAVTSVHFHPKKDRYFISGCWDRKLRLWSIETKRVKEWAQTNDVPVTAKFSPAGDRVVAGLMYGQVFVFHFDANGLRYFTQIECKNRKGKYRNGTKVTGIEFVRNGANPHTAQRAAGGQYNMLVTTNDSRLRYYTMHDFTQICKYKGLHNSKLLIRARISEDGEHVISGSEDGEQPLIVSLSPNANPNPNPTHDPNPGPNPKATSSFGTPLQRTHRGCSRRGIETCRTSTSARRTGMREWSATPSSCQRRRRSA
mmetsp:Transcript_1632/g.4511  ORF Transcript_1632/g.4511 Transcript_1632/m.4511 type:complete len:654 (-) Transcript_1632:312-2273(-)